MCVLYSGTTHVQTAVVDAHVIASDTHACRASTSTNNTTAMSKQCHVPAAPVNSCFRKSCVQFDTVLRSARTVVFTVLPPELAANRK